MLQRYEISLYDCVKKHNFLIFVDLITFYFMTEIKNKYTHSEEVVNAASHLVGTIMSIVVCSLFLHKAYQADNTLAVVSMSLYFFGVVSSYVASSVYHACPANKENSKYLLRKFDHAAIYWHIAGGVECD